MNFEFVTGNLAYSAEARTVVALSDGNSDIFDTRDTPISIGKETIAPWGADNDLPSRVMEKIRRNDIVSPNLLFNIQSGYAQGIRPVCRVVENGKVVGYEECLDERVLDFFEDNDVNGYFLEQLSDMMAFFNVFPEIILSRNGKQITGLRHLEAQYSRWGSMRSGERQIGRHYYAEWVAGSPKNGEMERSPVLSRYDTLSDLTTRIGSGSRDRRFVLQVSMPTPGRTYYSYPYWWSIFRSGWYDLSVMLPAFKKALIKNHLAVRYIVYISDEFWQEIKRRENVGPNDKEKEKEIKDREIRNILDFLGDEGGKGGGIVSAIKYMPSSGGKPMENKFIQIEPIKPAIEGGEFIEDAEEASNMISYAMGVHPNLNGATPGKSKGSLGGSDKRELFNIKQAMMRPFRDRLLKPLTLIKRYNGWPNDLVFAIPEHVFTTLDESHSGEKTQVKP